MAILWLILKIILWTVLGLLGLIFLLLILPITANLEYSKKEGFSLSVGVWRFQYPIFPEKETGQEKKEQEQAAPPKKEQPPKPISPVKQEGMPQSSPQPLKEQPSKPMSERPPQTKQPVEQSTPKRETAPPKPEAKSTAQPHEPEKDLRRLLHTAVQAVSLAGGVVRRLLAGIWVHQIRIYLPVYAGDAAKTAIRVGRIYAAAGAGMGVLKNFLHLSFKQYEIVPDYTNEKAEEAFFSCKITSALIIMVVVGIWALPKALRIFKEM